MAVRTFDRSRLRLGIVIAIICGSIAFLGLKALGEATTYYRNADEVVAERDELGTKRFRLQGIVQPGSVRDAGADVEFIVEYHCATVPVRHEGTRPSLFKDGIPVVLEGAFVSKTSRVFESDRILVRHTEEYRTKESQKAEATDNERCAS